MAAPILQAEGALAIATTATTVTPVIPAHALNDILICASGNWAPATAGALAKHTISSGWTELASLQIPASGDADGWIVWWWKRAASGSETNPTLTRTGDTGTDTNFTGRIYVIRGVITSDPAWDEVDPTTLYPTANQPVDALTVSGTERLAIHFLVKTDDFVTAPTVGAGAWTAGTQLETTTGTDHSQGSFRKDNVSANTGADASTVEATAAGGYAFLGISFKPVVVTVVEGSASGSGTGVASLSALLYVAGAMTSSGAGLATLAASFIMIPVLASGSGIGLGSSGVYIIIPTSALGSGIGGSSAVGAVTTPEGTGFIQCNAVFN